MRFFSDLILEVRGSERSKEIECFDAFQKSVSVKPRKFSDFQVTHSRCVQ